MVLVVAAVTSCSGVAAPVVESRSGGLPTRSPYASPTPSAGHSTKVMTAESAAVSIGYAVPSVTGLVTFTVRTDPQHLLGRPDGYVAAIVVFDQRVTCDDLGVGCGAEIEQWPTEVAAQHRAAFWPLLVREYHYRYGAVLIRVSGALSAADAMAYDRALWAG
jgi:hypothetical protein